MLNLRRLFTLFLFILLSLQSTWAVAGSYCQHEESINAQHFGHHEHRHQNQANDEEKAKNSKTAFAIDSDCDFCHLCCCVVLIETPTIRKPLVATTLYVLGTNHLLSVTLPPPDRPNWQHLVQFGEMVCCDLKL